MKGTASVQLRGACPAAMAGGSRTTSPRRPRARTSVPGPLHRRPGVFEHAPAPARGIPEVFDDLPVPLHRRPMVFYYPIGTRSRLPGDILLSPPSPSTANRGYFIIPVAPVCGFLGIFEAPAAGPRRLASAIPAHRSAASARRCNHNGQRQLDPGELSDGVSDFLPSSSRLGGHDEKISPHRRMRFGGRASPLPERAPHPATRAGTPRIYAAAAAFAHLQGACPSPERPSSSALSSMFHLTCEAPPQEG